MQRPGFDPAEAPLNEARITLTRRRQAIGLLLIAAAILAVAVLRAPAHVLFPPGWWRF